MCRPVGDRARLAGITRIFQSVCNVVHRLAGAIGNGGEVSPNETTSETYRISAELTGTIDPGIYWELAVTHGQNDFQIATEDTVACRFQAEMR